MKHLFQQWLASLFIIIGWVTFAPTARSVDPPPDGGYANANTAEGTNALLDLTTG